MNKGGKKEEKMRGSCFGCAVEGRGDINAQKRGGDEMGNAMKVSIGIGIVCYICVLVLCTGAVPAGFSKKIANSEVGNSQ